MADVPLLARLADAVARLPGADDDADLSMVVYDGGPAGAVLLWEHEDFGLSAVFGQGAATAEDRAAAERFIRRVEAEDPALVYSPTFYTALAAVLRPFRLRTLDAAA